MPDADDKRSRFQVLLDFLLRMFGKKPTPPAIRMHTCQFLCAEAQRAEAVRPSPR